MNGQSIIVALLVAACAVYAAWALAPRAARRRIATALLARADASRANAPRANAPRPDAPQNASGSAWPAPVVRFLERHARVDDGCGCDGCDVGAAKARPASPQDAARPITFHPRPPR